MKRFKASIIGGSGYGAGEIIRRLLIHPDVELVRVASIDYIGDPLSAAHPNLEGLSDLVFEKLTPEEAAANVNVVFPGGFVTAAWPRAWSGRSSSDSRPADIAHLH